MGRKKKPFIDKKNSITFKLVGRSQQDPLFVDETAPQYVLVEKKTKQEVLIDGDEKKCSKYKSSKDSRREEQIKYGIYFDDDYNYLQHLIDIDDLTTQNEIDFEPKESKAKILLPSSVFESTVKEKEDINKRAALPVGPQPDWDADIVAAMADDFDFDDPNNQINDDFVVQAMQPLENDDCIEECDDNLSTCGYDGSDNEADDQDSKNSVQHNQALLSNVNLRRYFGLDNNDDDDQTYKTSASTHFTEYSMSSSVLPRNENLKTLDERFEQMFIKEYADEIEIGGLDSDDIRGEIDPNQSELIAKLSKEYQDFRNGIIDEDHDSRDAIEFIRQRLGPIGENDENDGNLSGFESSDEDEREIIEIVNPARKNDDDRLDCETILSINESLYQSTLLNDVVDRYGRVRSKPSTSRIIINPRTGMPSNKIDSVIMKSQSKSNDQMSEIRSRLSELSHRPKHETSEERTLRKKELKELRSLRRMEKKANRLAFNREKILLHKTDLNKAFQKKISVG
ncbi:LTV1-like protein [Sarcoptes scabiei]|uniref:Protein LTV1 homolog n=1 Tax=Sarcoptes scabiei TaxID=52283 RepID=A0A132A9U8_SARSC|nr:LTV1-like protein [Sarcoptes scabiei]